MRNKMPSSLIYVNDNIPGYRRIRKDDEFIYQDQQERVIADEKILRRIAGLKIPPVWENAWICPKRGGHIQATGRDAKGRKQYIYHPRWNESNSELKYDHLLSFAQHLPQIRQALENGLRKRKWDKEKVVALAISLMDKSYLRVGNKYYEDENGTYGLTTLRRKHLRKNKEGLVLKYTAKSGKLRTVKIRDNRLQKLLRQCSELPGYEIFRYQTINGFHPISSQDINEYLYAVSGKRFTAKTFRTWGGTVLAVKFEPEARRICAGNPRKKAETTLVRSVAGELNNTVSICRKYYIHPLVLEKALHGKLGQYLPSFKESSKWYSPEELTVISILEQAKNKKSIC